jgi:hypothetical protein
MQQAVDQLSRRRRPRAVSFVATLLLVEALVVVLAGATMATIELAGLPIPDEAAERAFFPYVETLPGLGLAVVIIVAGGGLAMASVGLLRLREWAWVLAMSMQGVGLADALYETYQGQPQYITLAMGSFVVLVLNQREVRHAFDVRFHDV